MNKKTVEDIDVRGKKVLVRCDFNVPQDENGNITDNRRIIASLPTIKYLLEKNAKVILCSHLGRPKGEIKKEFSLAPVARELTNQLGIEVKDPLEISVDGSSIILNKHELSCVFCGSTKDLVEYKNKLVCAKCTENLNQLKEEK